MQAACSCASLEPVATMTINGGIPPSLPMSDWVVLLLLATASIARAACICTSSSGLLSHVIRCCTPPALATAT